MKRIHLFEFEDQRWFPVLLRNYMTDFLQFLANKAKVYAPVIDEIHTSMEESKCNQIIDLGSGSGGGLLWLSSQLKEKNPNLSITLTDYYPNLVSFAHVKEINPLFEYITESVDAKNVPTHLSGFRTQFLSFHHFKPNDATQILQNSVNTSQPIGIFEIQDRSLPSILAMLLSPISVLLTAPFITPFRFGRIVFTYLIPILPVVVLWDGIVSSLRTYSVSELRSLVENVKNQDTFHWKIEKKRSKKGFVIYLIGIPKS